jgi:hypothetical protein
MSKEAGHDPFVTSQQREAAKHRNTTSGLDHSMPVVSGHDESALSALPDHAGHGRPQVLARGARGKDADDVDIPS